MSASAGRVLLIHKGTYDNSATYNPMDEVFYDGSTYVCKATTTGNLPTNTTYWQIMAQKGADGGVPSGGTTGQVLTKASNTDNDVEWADTFSIEDAKDAEIIPTKNICGASLVQGGIVANGSYLPTNTIRACITDYIPVKAGQTYVVSVDTSLDGKTVQFNAHYYSTQSEVSHTGYELDWTVIGGSITIPSDATTYMRFTLRTSDNSTVSPSDFSNLMVCTLAEWNKSHDYEPYYIPLKDGKLDIADEQVLGAWNLQHKATNVSTTQRGVTFTINDDGTVTFSGTNEHAEELYYQLYTSVNIAQISIEGTPIQAGKTYYFRGSHSSATTTYYYIAYAFYDSSNTNIGGIVIDDQDIRFTVPTNAVTMRCTIVVRASAVVPVGTTYEPMISMKPNAPYVEYCFTNRELMKNEIKNPTILSSSYDLNNIVTAGFYYWTTSAPVNAPASKTWVSLMVVRCGTIIRQIAYHGTDMYIREYSGNPISWKSWYKFTGTVVS